MASLLFIAWSWKGLKNEHKDLFLGMLGATILSLAGMLACGRIGTHYYLTMGSAYCFLTGMAFPFSEIADKFLICHAAMIALILSACVVYRPAHMRLFYSNYANWEKPTEYKIAKFIRKNTHPGDSIYVLWPSGEGMAIIYFLSDRRALTRFFVSRHPSKRHEKVLYVPDQVLATFYLHPPKHFVYLPNTDEPRFLKKFMLDNYHVVQKFHKFMVYEISAMCRGWFYELG